MLGVSVNLISTAVGCRDEHSSFFRKDPCVDVLSVRRAVSCSMIKRVLRLVWRSCLNFQGVLKPTPSLRQVAVVVAPIFFVAALLGGSRTQFSGITA